MNVRLRKCGSIDIDLAIDQPDSIPGNRYHPLHEMLTGIHGILKDNDVSAMNMAIGHEKIFRRSAAVSQLVHQQVVTDEKRVLHRLRRNLKSLYCKGDDKDGDHNRR